MKTLTRFSMAVAAFFSIAAAFLIGYPQSGAAETLIARSQLRRTVDPSPRTAFGTVVMKIDSNGKETFQVNVRQLGEANFGLFVRDEPSFTTNFTFGAVLPPLDRTNARKGSWSRTLVGLNQAPDDFLPFVADLANLDNTEVDISQPGIPQVTTIFTNVVGGVTNISMGVTNVVGNTTNIINGIVLPNPGQTGEVFSVLWAPLYELSAKPSTLSYRRRGTLDTAGTASPNASGTVKIRFTGTSGRSQLDVRAVNLTRGQEYTLFVADRTNLDTFVMIPVDKMTQKELGSKARLVRDTQFGDPLPQQARDIGDLSGRVIQVRDEFEGVHLQGFMP